MNILRQNLAKLLDQSARKAISSMDPGSECANILENLDIDDILKNDIELICENVSFSETAKIISLSASINVASEDKQQIIKEEMKEFAEKLVAKIEQKNGKLKIPDHCRHLLLNL